MNGERGVRSVNNSLCVGFLSPLSAPTSVSQMLVFGARSECGHLSSLAAERVTFGPLGADKAIPVGGSIESLFADLLFCSGFVLCLPVIVDDDESRNRHSGAELTISGG